ncbi:glycosyltransferase [Micromonospora sp. M12]
MRALARLQDLEPTPTYTVAGRTHPKVIEHHGEAYRAGLHQLGAQLGVAHAVDYQDVYHDQETLGRLIRSADVVVLPYDSREQVTSGVLIEAVAAGVPVVATAFPHAVELLTGGPGLVVPTRTRRHWPRRSGGSWSNRAWPPGWPGGFVRWPRTCGGRRWRPATAPSLKNSWQPARPPSARCRRDDDHRSPRTSTGGRWVTAPAPSFAHLARLSDDTGLFEHARHAIVRREHGYCTDDVARGLVVVSREPEPSEEVLRLAERYLAFLTHAQDAGGAFHNRLGYDRRWADEPGLGDWWGRALWGLGTAVARSPPHGYARRRWSPSAGARPGVPRPRTMAFAGLGAVEVLRRHPGHVTAASLLADAAGAIGPAGTDQRWPWPRQELTYANAALAEVVIAASQLREGGPPLDDGLRMLTWLRDVQLRDGRLSVVPAGGWRRGAVRLHHDQQPIEVAALADACATAATVTGDPVWDTGVRQAIGWFLGDNDLGTPMWDPATGGGYDGLTAHGPNLNQGAESTLALISTLQHARRWA